LSSFLLLLLLVVLAKLRLVLAPVAALRAAEFNPVRRVATLIPHSLSLVSTA
jgi:hypothetical protein